MAAATLWRLLVASHVRCPMLSSGYRYSTAGELAQWEARVSGWTPSPPPPPRSDDDGPCQQRRRRAQHFQHAERPRAVCAVAGGAGGARRAGLRGVNEAAASFFSALLDTYQYSNQVSQFRPLLLLFFHRFSFTIRAGERELRHAASAAPSTLVRSCARAAAVAPRTLVARAQ